MMRRKDTIGLSQRVDLRGRPWGISGGGVGVIDPCPGLVVCDSFTDGDGVLLPNHLPEKGGPWTQGGLGSNITIQSNEADLGDASEKHALLAPSSYHVDVNVKGISAGAYGGMGLLFRGDLSTGNCLIAAICKGAKSQDVVVTRVTGWALVGGGLAAANAILPAAGTWVKLEVIYTDTHITVKVDDVTVINNVPEATYGGQTEIGIGHYPWSAETGMQWDLLRAW